jgi:ankyrin repeat protein
MYPNPQDVVPLPTRPDLDLYATQANDLSAACKARGRDGVRAWAEQWIDKQGRLDAFTDFAWNQFSAAGGCAVSDAQFLIARAYGFLSWPKFSQHIQALQLADSPTTAFETAADAIVAGDLVTLERSLRDHPALVHARSTREHRAALLHYVAANGVENYRQKTPKNIAQIAEVLLKAGAEVDAVADMYGGNATTLGLAATSIHPLKAGVQISLIDLLLDHGADMDRLGGAGRNVSIVNGCLANGRGEAAEYLASRGARLDLESASGVGRLDIVKGFFNRDGTLTANATAAQMRDGFAWACQYGRTAVVEFLLDHGIDVAANLLGETGLHWAAFGAHLDTVQLLLHRHAPVDVIDDRWEAPPLGWALHAWGNEPQTPLERYYAVVQMLVAAGATVKSEWLEHPAIQADAKMVAALTPDDARDIT